ncbi:MAG: serine hydrolase [Lawsonibacter sp.]
MKKRILSLSLTLSLLLSLLTVQTSAAFSDVSSSEPYLDAIEYVQTAGLMSAADGEEFSSQQPASRSTVALALYALAGKPALSTSDRSVRLADVDETEPYAGAMRWVRAGGLMVGFGQNRMGPSNPITREQLAVILYSYAKNYDLVLTKRAVLTGTDATASEWAQPALSWAIGNGVFTSIDTDAVITCGELAQVLLNLSKVAEDPVAEDLNAILNDAAAPITGYAVMAYRDGQLTYQRTGGSRYLDQQDPANNLPLELNSRYRTASISKIFTTIGAMRLVEQGKLDLDEDISTYLGFVVRNPNFPDIAITPRMLLSHTSSLRDGSIYSIPPEYGIKEFFSPDGKYWLNGEHFASTEDGVSCTPGQYFCYCNLNFAVIGTIIERLSGQRFDEYMKANILEPMGIKASYNPGDFDADEIKNVSVLYQKMQKNVWDVTGPYVAQIDDYRGQVPDRNEVIVTNPVLQDEDMIADLSDYQIGTNGSLFSPQGGLRISPDEMKVLIDMFLNNGTVNGKQILEPESVEEMFTPVWTYDEAAQNGHTIGLFYSYGLAIQTMTSQYGDRFVKDRDIVLSGHFGEAYGLLAGVFMDRETGDVIYYVMTGMGAPEDENYGEYSGMYKWEERFCTALLNDLFPDL